MQMWDWLVVTATAIVRNPADADDIVQEEIVKATKVSEKFQSRAELGGWLKLCVERAAFKVRDHRLRARDFDVRMPFDPEELYLDDPDADAALGSTNPLYAVAALLDRAPWATRRTAVRRLLSLPAGVAERLRGKPAQRFRADLERLRSWIEKQEQASFSEEITLPSQRSDVESALVAFRLETKPIKQRADEETRVVSLLRDLAQRFAFKGESFALATLLQDAMLGSGYFVNLWDVAQKEVELPMGDEPRYVKVWNPFRRGEPEIAAFQKGYRVINGLMAAYSCGLNSPGVAAGCAAAWRSAREIAASDPLEHFALVRFRRWVLRHVIRAIVKGYAREENVSLLLRE